MRKSFRSAVVTGAGSGIGKALVMRLLKAGVSVHGLDLNAASLKQLEEETGKFGYSFHAYRVDVSNNEAMKATAELIAKSDPCPNLWINNAGISAMGDFLEQTHEDFTRAIHVNLGALALGTRLALGFMEKQGEGTILNVASVAGFVPAPYLVAYSASKHAVVGFTRALREELRVKNSPVVLALASPGFVDTGMIERESMDGFPKWLSFTLSKPEDVAEEMWTGLTKGEEEILPTWNGKLLMGLNRISPWATQKSSRLLLTKSISDVLFWRMRPPKFRSVPKSTS